METLNSFLDLKLMLSVGLGLGLGALLLFVGAKLLEALSDAWDNWSSQRYFAKEAAKQEASRTQALEEKVAALQQHVFCREGCGCHGRNQ